MKGKETRVAPFNNRQLMLNFASAQKGAILTNEIRMTRFMSHFGADGCKMQVTQCSYCILSVWSIFMCDTATAKQPTLIFLLDLQETSVSWLRHSHAEGLSLPRLVPIPLGQARTDRNIGQTAQEMDLCQESFHGAPLP